MKTVWRVFAFEWRKLLKDIPRLIAFGTVFALIVCIALFCAFRLLGVHSGGEIEYTPWMEWTDELADKYRSLAEDYYRNYRIEIGELPVPEGGIYIHQSAEYLLKEYRRYSMLIEHALPTFMEGFSSRDLHFFPRLATGSSYPYLQAERMLMVQDVAYIFLPVLCLAIVGFAFASDHGLGTDRLLRGLGIKRGQRIAGKMLFSLALLFAAIALFALIGLPFCQAIPYAFYDGSRWVLTSSVAVYFLRWLDMGFALVALLFLFALLAEIIPSLGGLLLTCAVPSFALTPALYFIAAELTGGFSFSYAIYLPFINMMCGDGALDGLALYKYLPIAGILLISVGGLLVVSQNETESTAR